MDSLPWACCQEQGGSSLDGGGGLGEPEPPAACSQLRESLYVYLTFSKAKEKWTGNVWLDHKLLRREWAAQGILRTCRLPLLLRQGWREV